jgi:metallo-beta-lactamase family protein
VQKGKSIVFSGDVGNENAPIVRDTENLPEMDIMLCESTYGDKIHESIEDRDAMLLEVIKEGVKRGGTIMIPAFSLERTQELLYQIASHE